MNASQGLGGDVGQLMVSLFGMLHIITTAPVTYDPTAAPETVPLGPPPPSGHYVIALTLALSTHCHYG